MGPAVVGSSRAAVAENRDLNEITSDSELVVRCAWCERIKTGDEWAEVPEVQAMRLKRHHTHSICPDCFAKLTPPDRP
jgi:hypothetical protein